MPLDLTTVLQVRYKQNNGFANAHISVCLPRPSLCLGRSTDRKCHSHADQLHSAATFVSSSCQSNSPHSHCVDPSRKQIESALRGTIYDSYVRFIVWEGILGWWKEEYLDWPACQPDSGGILRTLDFSLDNVPEQAEGIWSALFRPRGNQHTLLGLLAPRRPSRPPPPPLSSLPVCPHEWAVPIHALNCESSLIWPRFLSDIPEGTPTPPHTPARELIELDTPEYAGRIRKELVIEKLLATAGVRLAAVLNELFDSETSFFGVE
jgi:hypothetical protein